MSVTLILNCTCWKNHFIMYASDYGYVPRIGDYITATKTSIHLIIKSTNPKSHWERNFGTFVLGDADTTSRVHTFEEIKADFEKCGWKILTPEVAKKEFPFFF